MSEVSIQRLDFICEQLIISTAIFSWKDWAWIVSDSYVSCFKCRIQIKWLFEVTDCNHIDKEMVKSQDTI